MAAKGKYTPERLELIYKVLSEGGTEKEAYTRAGITYETYYEWLRHKPEFAEGVKDAKKTYQEWWNTDCIKEAKKSLKALIMGQTYTEVQTEYGLNKEGKPVQTKRKEVEKKVLPNITAIIFALTNRAPEEWKNRLSQDIKGNLQTESKSELSLENVPTELLQEVAKYIRGE